MATYGHHADSVNGNANLRWVIAGAPGKAVIACSYIFTGIYGLTWVSPEALPCCTHVHEFNIHITGPYGMGLLLGNLPPKIPRQGCRSLSSWKLDLQLRTGLFRCTGIHQYPMEDVYYFRGVLHRDDIPRVSIVSRDGTAVARGSRLYI